MGRSHLRISPDWRRLRASLLTLWLLLSPSGFVGAAIQPDSRRITAEQIRLAAVTDLNNLGGRIEAGSRLELSAGRDVNLVSSTVDHQENSGSICQARSTSVERIATISVSQPDGVLVASAGRDINLIAALQAGNDLNLCTLVTGNSRNINLDDDNYTRRQQCSESGSRIGTQGNLRLTAGANLNARAATLTSTAGDIALAAGQDIRLTAGESVTRTADGSKDVSSTSRVSTSRETVYQTGVLATVVNAGHDLTLTAGTPDNAQTPGRSGKLSIQGSALSAGNSIDLNVGGNLAAQTATRDASGTLQADRITASGIVKGADRQQVSVSKTDDDQRKSQWDKGGSTANAATSQVLGNLAAQGVRSGANDSFTPEALQTGQAAVTALLQSAAKQILLYVLF